MNGRIQMWAFCWIPLAVVVIGVSFLCPAARGPSASTHDRGRDLCDLVQQRGEAVGKLVAAALIGERSWQAAGRPGRPGRPRTATRSPRPWDLRRPARLDSDHFSSADGGRSTPSMRLRGLSRRSWQRQTGWVSRRAPCRQWLRCPRYTLAGGHGRDTSSSTVVHCRSRHRGHRNKAVPGLPLVRKRRHKRLLGGRAEVRDEPPPLVQHQHRPEYRLLLELSPCLSALVGRRPQARS